jgi:hypothetical protein
MELGLGAGNGSLPEVDVPAIYEQNVNKGADKKNRGCYPSAIVRKFVSLMLGG